MILFQVCVRLVNSAVPHNLQESAKLICTLSDLSGNPILYKGVKDPLQLPCAAMELERSFFYAFKPFSFAFVKHIGIRALLKG